MVPHQITATPFILMFSIIGIVVMMMANTASSFLPSAHAPLDRQRWLTLGMTEDTTEKIETFRKADFVASVSEKTGLNKREAEESLKAVLDTLQEQVGAGKRVNLPGFGTFTLRERAARKGRNPRTGEELDIAASKNPGFTAAKAWKDTLNGK